MGGPIRPAPIRGVALQRSTQPKHRLPLPSQPLAHRFLRGVQLEADHRHRPVVFEVRGLRPAPAARCDHHLIAALPHRWRNLLPLTGLTRHQVHAVCAAARHTLPPRPGRPWSLPLPVRVLLMLIPLRTNLTTRALAVLSASSQSTWIGSFTT
ncbi:hypothetical protein AWC01_12760 [Mycobacterium doricum]|uniref:Uncharacterized protein n=1 Tax=Mycolicibacterium doricum TaxID=126673 RepID=A0A1X1T4G6_9MYCO|nr:hypothetical protein AWC01_12760 [Mycolicibacterium doricum]